MSIEEGTAWVDISPDPDVFGGRLAVNYCEGWAGMICDEAGGFVGFAQAREALLWQRARRLREGRHPITGEVLTGESPQALLDLLTRGAE